MTQHDDPPPNENARKRKPFILCCAFVLLLIDLHHFSITLCKQRLRQVLQDGKAVVQQRQALSQVLVVKTKLLLL